MRNRYPPPEDAGGGGGGGWVANFVPPAVTCKRRLLDFELTFKPLLTNRKVRETRKSKRRHSKCKLLHNHRIPKEYEYSNTNQSARISIITCAIGLLKIAVTWYKIRHAGGQAYYSRTGTAKQCYFILSSLDFLCFGCPSAGIIISLPSSMADFVPCDR